MSPTVAHAPGRDRPLPPADPPGWPGPEVPDDGGGGLGWPGDLPDGAGPDRRA
ncbi:hypothetical protein OF117_13735 [Geodermatophilus sp. YIM 151500]|uniref:hypothetical protein n=1 Tax=Geodermatophilus sp. YIM 151500 TaxID=2984531 RepID=UPI0021E3624E|nr:hypothetical protein [Geodermatophilus sp. YIM 151500]MCV2490425.1 hypothetical protein [Geodermatophilus sp. YIM 151500]